MLPRCRVEPEVLEWARTSIRLELIDAARRAGVDADALAEWESSGATLAFTRLEKLAQAYRMPVAALLYPQKPVDAPLPIDRRTLQHKVAFEFTTPTILAILFAADVQASARELLMVEGRTAPALPTVGSASAPELASLLRTHFGVSIEEQRTFRKAGKALDAWTRSLGELGVYVVHRKWPMNEGRALVLGGRCPVIVLNDADEDVAQVFSLLHEFSHVLRGEDSVCDGLVAGYEDRDRAPEVYCNAFAGEFLVPSQALLGHALVAGHHGSEWKDSILRGLASDFAVSRETVLRRLLTVGLTTTSVYERERERLQTEYQEYTLRVAQQRQKRKKSSGPPWPDRVVHSRGAVFSGQVIGAHLAGAISAAEASSYLGTTPRHLQGIQDIIS